MAQFFWRTLYVAKMVHAYVELCRIYTDLNLASPQLGHIVGNFHYYHYCSASGSIVMSVSVCVCVCACARALECAYCVVLWITS